MTKLVDHKCNAARFSSSKTQPLLPKQVSSIADTVTNLTISKQAPFTIKCLSLAEMALRREWGLCFNWDEKFTVGHKYHPTQFLCLLADILEDPPCTLFDFHARGTSGNLWCCGKWHTLYILSYPHWLCCALYIESHQKHFYSCCGHACWLGFHKQLCSRPFGEVPWPHSPAITSSSGYIGNGETLQYDNECFQVLLTLL